ncbi:MAG: phosphate acyltransferase, partial [Planctomycetota bacterium]
MDKVMDQLRIRARALQRRVIFPETGDPRVLLAARQLVTEGLARVSLVAAQDAALEGGPLPPAIQLVSPSDQPLR